MRAKVFPAWMYADPQTIIERLVARQGQHEAVEVGETRERPKRDRYYTLARRVRVREVMRKG